MKSGVLIVFGVMLYSQIIGAQAMHHPLPPTPDQREGAAYMTLGHILRLSDREVRSVYGINKSLAVEYILDWKNPRKKARLPRRAGEEEPPVPQASSDPAPEDGTIPILVGWGQFHRGGPEGTEGPDLGTLTDQSGVVIPRGFGAEGPRLGERVVFPPIPDFPWPSTIQFPDAQLPLGTSDAAIPSTIPLPDDQTTPCPVCC
jgi:hypothetical protein